MGLTASHSSDNNDTRQRPGRLQQGTRFGSELETLGLAIWQAYSREASVMQTSEYNRLSTLLRRTTTTGDNLTFLLDLFSDEITTKDLTLIISWMTVCSKLDSDLMAAVLKPLHSLLDNSSVRREDLSRRLKAIYPDIGRDLMRVVCCRVTGDPDSILLDFSTRLPSTDLLKPGLLWLLSCVLSMPYKRMDSSPHSQVSLLEIEQLQHLRCLYNSSTNGFSFSKLKETSFDYRGPLLLLLRTHDNLFCLASDEGLSDSMKTYGGEETVLFRILPEFTKLVSGRLTAGPKKDGKGVIYSNFTAKTVPQGLMVGHQPLTSSAIAVDEGFSTLRFVGGPPTKLTAVEVWAAGSAAHLQNLTSHKDWEVKEVNRAKNRKIEPHGGQWQESVDRQLLGLAGVNVYHSHALPSEESQPN